MYAPIEIARFALSEFERGLVGLTDEEARTRLKKADDTLMNAITWVIGHVARHWLGLEAYAKQRQIAGSLQQFGRGPSVDPTLPPLTDVLQLLQDVEASIDWIASAGDALLSTIREDPAPGDNIGTRLMRACLHTWFHIGEINAIRQMLGHPEIAFVGPMAGNLEWRSA